MLDKALDSFVEGCVHGLIMESVIQCLCVKTICNLLMTLPLNTVLWGKGNPGFLVATTPNLLKNIRSL